MLRLLPALWASLLFLVPFGASAQTVRGFVTDASDGQPLPLVNVIAERLTDGEPDGRTVGAATNTDGFYTLAGLSAGEWIVRASFIGYQPFEETVTLAGGEVRQLSFALAEIDAALGEVTVESERTTGAARTVAGLQSISPAEIAIVPGPDVSADLVNYLTTLPGVVTTGDRGGQLFIRGGEPSQNEVLIDGIPLFQPFHLLGFYSAFPNDILARADLYAGGYAARYGGRLSSVLDIATRTGNKRRFVGNASVAPFVSGAMVEGPLVRDQVSFLASGRVSVIEQGAANLVDAPLPFNFADVFGKVHANVGESAQVSVSGIYTTDRGRLGEDGTDGGGAAPEELRYTNLGAGARYLFLPRNIPILAEALLSVARFETEIGEPGVPSRESAVARLSGSANITYFLGSFNLRAGAFLKTTEVNSRLGGLYQNVESERVFVTEAGVYAEPEIAFGGLLLTPGLHIATSPNQGNTFIEPRFRAVWEGGIHQVSAAAGRFHQEVVGLSDRRDATSVFTAWTVSPSGRPAEAWHLVGGYRISPLPQLDLAVEGFYKRLDNLSVAEWTAYPRLTTTLQPASGEVFGLDLRAEARVGSVFTALSYGLSDVQYDAEGRSLELWYGTETLSFRPPHDRRHQASALIGAGIAGFEVSARWQFGSGLPFSRALGFDEFVLMDGQTDPTAGPGAPRVIYERPYNAELPTYHRLDVSAERTFDLGAASLTAQAGVVNLYDRRNLFYYDIFTLRRVDQLPIIPTFGLKVNFE